MGTSYSLFSKKWEINI